MPHWKLLALSDKAKSFSGPHGCDLILDESRESRIGRAVNGKGNYCLPPDWVQISSRHLRLFFDRDKGCWMAEDSSTNGTFVNGQRLAKGKPAPLHLGDRLRLSVVPPSEPQNVFEYLLQQCPDIPGPAVSAVQLHAAAGAPAAPCLKRKEGEGASGVSESQPTKKRARVQQGGGGGGALDSPGCGGGCKDMHELLQLQRNNEELREKLNKARVEREALEAKHAEALAQAKQEAGGQVATARNGQAAAETAQRAAEAAAAAAAERMAALEGQVARLEEQAAGAEERAAALGGELQHAQQGVEGARVALEGERAQREALEGQLQEARGQVEALEGQVEQRQAAITALEVALQHREIEAAKAAQQLQAVQEQARGVEERGTSLAVQLSELHGRHMQLEAAFGRQERELAMARGQLGEQGKRLETMKMQEEKLKEQQLVVRACIGHIRTYAASSTAAKQALDAGFDQLEAGFSQVLRAKRGADTAYDAMLEQISVVTDHLAGADSLLTVPAHGGPAAAPEPAGPPGEGGDGAGWGGGSFEAPQGTPLAEGGHGKTEWGQGEGEEGDEGDQPLDKQQQQQQVGLPEVDGTQQQEEMEAAEEGVGEAPVGAGAAAAAAAQLAGLVETQRAPARGPGVGMAALAQASQAGPPPAAVLPTQAAGGGAGGTQQAPAAHGSAQQTLEQQRQQPAVVAQEAPTELGAEIFAAEGQEGGAPGEGGSIECAEGMEGVELGEGQLEGDTQGEGDYDGETQGDAEEEVDVEVAAAASAQVAAALEVAHTVTAPPGAAAAACPALSDEMANLLPDFMAAGMAAAGAMVQQGREESAAEGARGEGGGPAGEAALLDGWVGVEEERAAASDEEYETEGIRERTGGPAAPGASLGVREEEEEEESGRRWLQAGSVGGGGVGAVGGREASVAGPASVYDCSTQPGPSDSDLGMPRRASQSCKQELLHGEEEEEFGRQGRDANDENQPSTGNVLVLQAPGTQEHSKRLSAIPESEPTDSP